MPKDVLLLAPKHASARTDLSQSRLAQLASLGELEVMRDSLGRRLYVAEDIEKFIEKREVQRREREQQAQPNAPAK
jgi:hypothetical protein